MRRVKQYIVKRLCREVDEGTMGFHDYVMKKEDLEKYIERVSDKANELGNVLNISYLSGDIAVIVYIDITE